MNSFMDAVVQIVPFLIVLGSLFYIWHKAPRRNGQKHLITSSSPKSWKISGLYYFVLAGLVFIPVHFVHGYKHPGMGYAFVVLLLIVGVVLLVHGFREQRSTDRRD